VGQLNDYGYTQDPGKAGDSRWVGRPAYPAARYALKDDPSTAPGAIFSGLQRLIRVRAAAPEFAGGRLVPFGTNNPSVLGYQRPSTPGPKPSLVLVLANFADSRQEVTAETLSGLPGSAVDLISGREMTASAGLGLEPHQVLWLRYPLEASI
jgi:amylosucrase